MSELPLSEKEIRLELFAGLHPSNSQPIFEQVLAAAGEKENEYRLLKSPLFVRGVAAQDTVKIQPESRGRFEVLQRSGNLALRIFFREKDENLSNSIVAELEKLGGSIDINSDRALAVSIYFGIGFSTIEDMVSKLIKDTDCQWNYGNVYDSESGEPLNWWQAMLQA